MPGRHAVRGMVRHRISLLKAGDVAEEVSGNSHVADDKPLSWAPLAERGAHSLFTEARLISSARVRFRP